MTEQTQQSPAAVPQAQELKAGEGNRNAEVKANVSAETSQTPPAQKGEDTPAEVAFVNRATGRTYKSVEEAEKGLKETVNYVGSLGQRAALVEKLADKIAKENNASKEAALKYIESLLETDASEGAVNEPSEVQQQVAPARTSVKTPQDYDKELITEELAELKFLRKHPEAEPQVAMIKKIKRGGDERDFTKIYEEDILPLVDTGKKQAYETQTSKESASVAVPTTPGGAPDPYQETFNAFTKGKASVMDVMRAKGFELKARE